MKTRGSIEIYNLVAKGNTQVINPLVKNYGISLLGEFDADMDKISFNDNGIRHLQGNMNFSALDVNGVLRLSVGDVECVFQLEDEFTNIDVSNSQGHVGLYGTIQLYNDMRYQLDITANKNDKSTDAIVNGLKFIGELQEDGSVKLSQSGSLAI